MIDLIALAAGVVGGASFVGAVLAGASVGWRRGYDKGFDEGFREAEIEDRTIDAEWEENVPAQAIAHLVKGKAPIRRLQ